MAEAIQVGIDYEVGKARIEMVTRLFKYRQALEKIIECKGKVGLCDHAEPFTPHRIAADALKD